MSSICLFIDCDVIVYLARLFNQPLDSRSVIIIIRLVKSESAASADLNNIHNIMGRAAN